MSEKIGVIGSGQVGQVLADGFVKHGYEVMRGIARAREARGVDEGGRRKSVRRDVRGDGALRRDRRPGGEGLGRGERDRAVR